MDAAKISNALDKIRAGGELMLFGIDEKPGVQTKALLRALLWLLIGFVCAAVLAFLGRTAMIAGVAIFLGSLVAASITYQLYNTGSRSIILSPTSFSYQDGKTSGRVAWDDVIDRFEPVRNEPNQTGASIQFTVLKRRSEEHLAKVIQVSWASVPEDMVLELLNLYKLRSNRGST